jgi:hypothetical protein
LHALWAGAGIEGRGIEAFTPWSVPGGTQHVLAPEIEQNSGLTLFWSLPSKPEFGSVSMIDFRHRNQRRAIT